jgi:hypothetical protein
MFCWGCSISEVYGPLVDLMDYIDGEGVYCQCSPSPMDVRGDSGHAKDTSDLISDAKSDSDGLQQREAALISQ